MDCRHCGAELGTNDKFCSVCGQPGPSPAPNEHDPLADHELPPVAFQTGGATAKKPSLLDEPGEAPGESFGAGQLPKAVATPTPWWKRTPARIAGIATVVLLTIAAWIITTGGNPGADSAASGDPTSTTVDGSATSTADDSGAVGTDQDNDGVADAADDCPNTPTGLAVNANGCNNDEEVDPLVPDVIGLAESDAVNRLAAEGISVSVEQDSSNTVANGTVINQVPRAGSMSSAVTITVSSGSTAPEYQEVVVTLDEVCEHLHTSGSVANIVASDTFATPILPLATGGRRCIELLGGADFAEYCEGKFAAEAVNDVGSWDTWRCESTTANENLYGITMSRACQWQYGNDDLTAETLDVNEPTSWICLDDGANIGGVNLDGYCVSQGFSGVRLEPPENALSWSCVEFISWDVNSFEIDIELICSTLHPTALQAALAPTGGQFAECWDVFEAPDIDGYCRVRGGTTHTADPPTCLLPVG